MGFSFHLYHAWQTLNMAVCSFHYPHFLPLGFKRPAQGHINMQRKQIQPKRWEVQESKATVIMKVERTGYIFLNWGLSLELCKC